MTSTTDKPEPRTFFGLSMTQLGGGALASVTAAILASRLGVNGTLVGAAFGSVVSAMGGAVYTHSLNRAQEQVVTLTRTVLPGSRPGAGNGTASDGASEDDATSDGAEPTVTETTVTETTLPAAGSSGRTRRVPGWKTWVGAAVALFAISILSITVFEAFIGERISDVGRTTTGNSGTTVGSLVGGDSDSSDSTPSPSSTDTSTSSTSTDGSSPSPSSTDASPTSTDATSSSPEPTQQSSPATDTNTATDPAVTPTASAQQ